MTSQVGFLCATTPRFAFNTLRHARFCLYPSCLSPSCCFRVQPQLPVWGAEGPRCQRWWMAFNRSAHAQFLSYPLLLLYALCVLTRLALSVCSRGLLPAYTTVRVTTTLSMSGRLGSCKTEILRSRNSRLIGTHG